MSAPIRRLFFLLLLVALIVPASQAADSTPAFDAANKLYEQSRFADAAAAYGKLLESNPHSETLHFNLGNAWFKAGQMGRAIAAYREAERLAPREPGVRFNLQFVRKKVSGGESARGSLVHRTLSALTVKEWTLLAGVAFWSWFGLLAWREARPGSRGSVSGYTATVGVVTVALIGCAVAAAAQWSQVDAVVSVPEAIVRSGPLEEAKVLHQLRDGVELTLLDKKDVMSGEQKQTWIQVRDAAGRAGWLKSDQVVEVPAVGTETARR